MQFDYDATPINRKEFDKIKIEKFKPVVSIITPFYDSAEYIEDTAKCVLNQTFPWFEWIIVDDGSKDKKSLEVLSKLEKSDNRIRVFHKKNEGPAAARDYGAKKTSGDSKYLLLLDDDDLIETNYIECCFLSLLTNPNASFSYTNSVGFGALNYVWDKHMDINTETKENLLVVTALIKKYDYLKSGGFGTKLKNINEDWLFWLKLFSKSKIPVRLNYYGFWYRRKENGELKRSESNIKLTEKLMKPYIEKVDLNIKPIEYPKDSYQWNDVFMPGVDFKVYSKLKSDKTNILMIMPHVVMGGADKFNIDFLKGLSKKYTVTAIFTNISDNNWLSEIKKYVDSYYILPSFLERKYWHGFLDYLIEKNDTKLIFNTNSVYGYMCLPYLKSRHNNIKVLDYIHMEEWYNRNGGYSRDSTSVASIIDKTLVCNKNSENILIDYFGRKKTEIDTVYIGVDEKKFKNDYSKEKIKDIKIKYSIPLDKKVITFIARIADQKRPFLLAKIMKRFCENYKDSIFVICGAGPLLDQLKQVVNNYKLTNHVIFLGSISNTKEIYAISDCTLNCSIKEGLALTTYESLSMGVPVVSSKVGGQAEIIDETVGFVINTLQEEKDVLNYEYDDNEINAYVTSLRTVLNKNQYYRSNCRKKILSGFTINHMNNNMNKTIDLLIKNKTTKSFNNQDVAKELLNQYLLESTGEYNSLIYNERLKYVNNSSKTSKIFNFYAKAATKLHIYNEMKVIKKIIKKIVGLFMIPFYVVKLIIMFIQKIIRFIIKIFKKIYCTIKGVII